jgi:carotenoid 1,2-hydratase
LDVKQTSKVGFDQSVAPGGYAWWYVDAVSDDGEHALTLIAFVGSVFSPYYAWARRRHGVARADPNQHCAINVGLYDLSKEKRYGNRWTMTERGERSVQRDATRLQIGLSKLHWQNGELIATVNEVTAPIPRRVKGLVRLTPSIDVHATNHTVVIDGAGQHFWRPIAPTARAEVEFEAPKLRWTGHAYLDSNYGHAPLESAFRDWQWARATLADGSTAVVYDVTLSDGTGQRLARRYTPNGVACDFVATAPVALDTTGWCIARACHSTSVTHPRIAATLESGPFYARSLVNTEWLGESVQAVHESLSLTRFQRPVVQAMLPFRMPRWS